MLSMRMIEDSSGPAADTGTAVHAAVEYWHTHREVAEPIVASMKEVAAKCRDLFPLADLDDAERQFRAYCADPRNQTAIIVKTEQKVSFTIPAHETDETKQEIVITGTLDQIRKEGGVYSVHDIKTSKRPGWDLLNDHAMQIAAYSIGATQLMGCDVQPGSLIRTRGYLVRGVDPAKKPPGVFFYFPWTLRDAPLILDAIRITVANIRNGYVVVGPGQECNWCPAGGLQSCLPKLIQLSGV